MDTYFNIRQELKVFYCKRTSVFINYCIFQKWETKMYILIASLSHNDFVKIYKLGNFFLLFMGLCKIRVDNSLQGVYTYLLQH